MSTPDQPNKRSSTNRPGESREQRQAGDQGSSEFGSFVSSSVRNSFRQLKREAERTNPKQEPKPTARSASEQSRRRAGTGEPTIPSGPVGRKWRDALGGSTQPTETTEEIPDEAEAPDQRKPFNPGAWFRRTFLDENGPNRKFLALLGAIILIIIVVIYFVLQGGGDNGEGGDGSDVTPTATTNVISPNRTSTPQDDDTPTTPRTALERTPRATATSAIEQGGDNQRDQNNEDEAADEGT
jgi:hypothetical protein